MQYNLPLNTPRWVDNTIVFATDAVSSIASAARAVGRFVSANRAFLCLAGGVAFNVASTIIGIVATEKYRDGQWKSCTPEEEASARKKKYISWGVSAACAVIGNGLCVTSFIMKQHEVSALSKALAAASNALPAGAVALIGGDDSEDGTDAVGVSTNDFTIPVEESSIVPMFSVADDPYGAIVQFNRAVEKFKAKLGPHRSGISWNEFCRQVRGDKKQDVPYGWSIGFRDPDKIKAYLVNDKGLCLDPDDAIRYVVVNGGEGFSWKFTGLEDLTGGTHFILRGAK